MLNLRLVPWSALPLALENNLRRIEPPDKVYRYFLSVIRWRFEADAAWLYRRLRHNRRVSEKLMSGDASLLDEHLVEPFARLEHPPVPPNILLAPFRPHERVEGILGVARRGREFDAGQGRVLNRLTGLLAREIERRHGEALRRTLDRIHNRALSGLRASDLVYRILDGLQQLVRYDHSATLFALRQGSETLRVVAQKIVWRKAKSSRIGDEVRTTARQLREWTRDETRVFQEKDGPGFIDHHRPGSAPQVSSLLVASLLYRSRRIGFLELAGAERLPFDDWDREVVRRFLPVTAFGLSGLILEDGPAT